MDDLISRATAIDALRAMQTYKLFAGDDMRVIDQAGAQTELMLLPPAQPTFDARDTQYNIPIGTDLISRSALIDALAQHPFVGSKVFAIVRELPSATDAAAYQRGYEDGFREGRTRKELIDALDDDLK